MKTYRRAVLVRRPQSADDLGEIRIEDAAWRLLEQGCFLARLRYLSIDVAMRSWMMDSHSYVATIPIGAVPRACGLAEVIESKHSGFQNGDVVLGDFGAQELVVSDGSGVVRVPTETIDPARWAGSLGLTTGMTAYLGLTKVGQPKPGQTVLVSGASGAVGSIVGQVARLLGCRVVGFAGGAERCREAVQDLGFDACLDYRAPDLADDLHAACPERVDLFFDNTGGAILDHALDWMNPHGRIVLCGSTAARATGEPPVINAVRSLIIDRLTVQGFILFDHAAAYGEAVAKLAAWHDSGDLRIFVPEDIREGGLEGFSSALKDAVEGNNSGKLILKL